MIYYGNMYIGMFQLDLSYGLILYVITKAIYKKIK